MTRSRLPLACLACLAALAAARPAAAQDEPTGPRPRLLLDDELRAAWKAQAKQKGSAVAASIGACDDFRARPERFSRDLYMGLDWAKRLQACLVAWAATGKDEHARTAMRFFVAMLDDLDNVGDGKGGEVFARRNSGYAIRSVPYAALAYDWLHDHKLMTDEVKARARERFKAWTDWYLDKGYRARHPGTNYQAGYLIAATFIAIAQGGEAGRPGARLWAHVVDELWGKDMKRALAPGGLLDGGDWGEGWQYGPWSVAEYALGARALRRHGVEVPHVEGWLEAVLRRAIHGLNPGDGMFVGGDTGADTASLPPAYLAFAAPLIGDAAPEVQAWARAVIAELGVTSSDFPLYEALAEARKPPKAKLPLDAWPTSYLATGVGNYYSRSHWGRSAVWMVTQCGKTIDVDHRHPNAGNVVLSRGRDEVIVDPSPYGTLSTLPGNAPTVKSAHLPDTYKPSQAFWSEQTRFEWARQTASGIVAARCDYADQYKFQHRASDVPEAQRDVVLVPYAKGDAAAMVVIDRARSGEKGRELYLRFRTPADLALSGDVAQGKVGKTQLTIRRVSSSSGAPEVRQLGKGNCFGEGVTRGGCDIPRFPVGEYRLVVEGPAMTAIHVIDVADPAKAAPAVATVTGAEGVVLARDGRHAVVVDARGKDVTYTAPKAAQSYHVVVGAAHQGGKAAVAAEPAGDGCKVTVKAAGGGTKIDARPVVIVLDDACKLSEDPSQAQPLAATGGGGTQVASLGHGGEDVSDDGDATGDGDRAGVGGIGGDDIGGPAPPRSARSGCCGAQAAPGSPLAMTAVVALGLLVLLRRRGASTRPRRRR